MTIHSFRVLWCTIRQMVWILRKLGFPPINIWNLHCGLSTKTSSLGHKWMSSPISSHGSNRDKNAQSNQVEINLDFISSCFPLPPSPLPLPPSNHCFQTKRQASYPKCYDQNGLDRPRQTVWLANVTPGYPLSHFLASNKFFQSKKM